MDGPATSPAPVARAEPVSRTGAAEHGIVVIGASAGGSAALIEVLGQLPEDLPAAIFIAYHMPAGALSSLARVLQSATSLPVRNAQDREEIHHGTIYVAPPDRHLLVKRGQLRVTQGPRENRWRPSIDALFRSAAVAYGPGVVGIVLTGMLDDGTAGLLAVKKCGGVTVVQEPAEAVHPEMPESALANVAIDFRLPLAEMGKAIVRLAAAPPGEAPPIPRELEAEARIAEEGRSTVEFHDEHGNDTSLTCPDCGGPLEERSKDGFPVFRCLVGHAWAPQSLLASSDEQLEATLWAAIRLFRQRANLLNKMAQRERDAGRERLAENYRQTAAEAIEHSGRLQKWAINSVDLSEKPS
jgi:two-component system chemotaxis response regulator CheB